MKVNQERVNQAIELRRQGKTLDEIASLMIVDRTTVAHWFIGVQFLPEDLKRINDNKLERRSKRLNVVNCENKKIEGLAPTSKNYAKYLQAVELRKNGCGLGDIANRLGVAKSSICVWLKHIKLTTHQKQCLMGCQPGNVSPARQKVNEGNRQRYRDLRNIARAQGYKEALGDPVHVAGCMLYWAEGSKSVSAVTFSNTDALMQKKFKEFLEYLKVPDEKIKFVTYVHNTEGNATHDECKIFWEEKLGISKDQIKVFDANDNRGDSKAKSRYPFGVGRLVVHDYTVVQRIYGGIERYIGAEIPYGRK